MKKLWIVMLMVGTMALTLSGCGGGNKGYMSANETLIPNVVIEKFYGSYPGARDVKWDTEDGLYNVDFELGDQDLKARYTPDGYLLEIDS